MTETERILQAALDANPYDFVCRMALADHLIEIGDERGEGYKALAELERVPVMVLGQWYWFGETAMKWPYSHLTDSWLQIDSVNSSTNKSAEGGFINHDGVAFYGQFWTKQLAEDAAALAWLKLNQNEREYAYRKYHRGAK